MNRPSNIKKEDIVRWSEFIDSDPYLPKDLLTIPEFREICYAGMWLIEELEKHQCPSDLAVRIQWTAGKMSYKKEPWEIHTKIIDQYKDGSLVIEHDKNVTLN